MNRKDLGFIVSRALAVFAALIAIQEGWMLANIFLTRDAPRDPIRSPNVAGAMILLAVYVACLTALAALLWLRAHRFATLSWQRQDPSDASRFAETCERSLTSASSNGALYPLWGAMGLFVCLKGTSRAVDILVTRWWFNLDEPWLPMKLDWKLYCVEAAAGLTIFAICVIFNSNTHRGALSE